jgi:hypothetical protein
MIQVQTDASTGNEIVDLAIGNLGRFLHGGLKEKKINQY